jgi:hypothetical protein
MREVLIQTGIKTYYHLRVGKSAVFVDGPKITVMAQVTISRDFDGSFRYKNPHRAPKKVIKEAEKILAELF